MPHIHILNLNSILCRSLSKRCPMKSILSKPRNAARIFYCMRIRHFKSQVTHFNTALHFYNVISSILKGCKNVSRFMSHHPIAKNVVTPGLILYPWFHRVIAKKCHSTRIDIRYSVIIPLLSYCCSPCITTFNPFLN